MVRETASQGIPFGSRFLSSRVRDIFINADLYRKMWLPIPGKRENEVLKEPLGRVSTTVATEMWWDRGRIRSNAH